MKIQPKFAFAFLGAVVATTAAFAVLQQQTTIGKIFPEIIVDEWHYIKIMPTELNLAPSRAAKGVARGEKMSPSIQQALAAMTSSDPGDKGNGYIDELNMMEQFAYSVKEVTGSDGTTLMRIKPKPVGKTHESQAAITILRGRDVNPIVKPESIKDREVRRAYMEANGPRSPRDPDVFVSFEPDL